MLKKLHRLFFPSEHNNHRPKILHLSSINTFILLALLLQLGLSMVQRFYPGVLGFATNIAPEEIIRLTNEERSKNGLPSLNANATLSAAALQKGADMFAKNYWAHFAPDGTSPWTFFKNAGYSYLYAGENLARDFQSSPEVVQAWINSPTHKDNIVNANYSEIGVAVINGVLSGQETTLVIQFFGRPTTAFVAQAEVPQVQSVQQVRPEPTVTPTQALRVPAIQIQEPIQESVLNQPTTILQAELPPTTLQTYQPTTKYRFLGLSAFDLTRRFSLALLLLLIVVLVIDSILVVKRKTVRVAGKNIVHLTFLVIIVIIILLSSAGRII
jgi:hypothetical protein